MTGRASRPFAGSTTDALPENEHGHKGTPRGERRRLGFVEGGDALLPGLRAGVRGREFARRPLLETGIDTSGLAVRIG